MSFPVVRLIPVLSILLVVPATGPAHAADPASTEVHVRTTDRHMAALFAQALTESTVVRVLVERLDRSDVIVYLRFRRDLPSYLDGQLTFLGSGCGSRYVVVGIAWGRSDTRLIATLGHELQHAIEIAERSDIVDRESLMKAYASLGIMTLRTLSTSFETQAAIEAGDRVWSEITSRRRRVAARREEPEVRP